MSGNRGVPDRGAVPAPWRWVSSANSPATGRASCWPAGVVPAICRSV